MIVWVKTHLSACSPPNPIRCAAIHLLALPYGHACKPFLSHCAHQGCQMMQHSAMSAASSWRMLSTGGAGGERGAVGGAGGDGLFAQQGGARAARDRHRQRRAGGELAGGPWRRRRRRHAAPRAQGAPHRIIAVSNAKGKPRAKVYKQKHCDARRSCVATCFQLIFDAHDVLERRQQPCSCHVATAACRLCLCPSSPVCRLNLLMVGAVCQHLRSRLARKLVLTGGEEAPAQRRRGSPGSGGPAPQGQGKAGGIPTCFVSPESSA